MSSKRLNQESFRKRRNNYLRRGSELSVAYDAKFYVCIERNGRLAIFNSQPKNPEWPPTREKIDRLYPVPLLKTPSDYAATPSKKKRSSAEDSSSALKALPKPPVPQYSQKETSVEQAV